MSKSLFGQLCAYLMSCDTHHRTCPRYLPKECSRQVSKKFEKYFSSYRADKHGHTDGQTDRRTDRQTDRQTDRRTDAGNDNTPPALGPRGNKKYSAHLISLASCKTAVTPLLMHWSYCSLVLNHWYIIVTFAQSSYKRNTQKFACEWMYGVSLVSLYLTKTDHYPLVYSKPIVCDSGLQYLSRPHSSHTLLWRHNEHDCVSNHQPCDCLLNHLFTCRSKKTSKLCFTGLCARQLLFELFNLFPFSNKQYIKKWVNFLYPAPLFTLPRPSIPAY